MKLSKKVRKKQEELYLPREEIFDLRKVYCYWTEMFFRSRRCWWNILIFTIIKDFVVYRSQCFLSQVSWEPVVVWLKQLTSILLIIICIYFCSMAFTSRNLLGDSKLPYCPFEDIFSEFLFSKDSWHVSVPVCLYVPPALFFIKSSRLISPGI